MEVTVGMFLLLLVLAFGCEYIDSALGMGYGTILTPVLLILGFEPLVVVPSVLLSQAFGGLSASIFHHQFKNVSFKKGSEDLKIVFIICGFGIVATIFAALISIKLPKLLLETYIGSLVLVMGILILLNRTLKFSMKKMMLVGIISAFNKGISGGGFGPVVTGGQIVAGQSHRPAIGITTLAEAPICICAFFTYLIARTVQTFNTPILDLPFNSFIKEMLSPKLFQWQVMTALLIGSVLITPFGAFTTKFLNKQRARYITGIVITVLGIWTLIKVWA